MEGHKIRSTPEVAMPSASRRQFLQGALRSAAVAPPFVGGWTRSRSLAAEPGAEDVDWEAVRSRFAFEESAVPMNAGNLCPMPISIAERVAELTRDIDVDCSHQNRAKYADLLEAARSKVARQIGASADEIALVRNTSEGNNLVNSGLSLREGDEVLVWDENHPTNNVAWDVRAARLGLRVQRLSVVDPRDVGHIVEMFRRALRPRTRVLAVTLCSNVSGLRLPIRELCDLAHSRGIFVHVDGAQAWGVIDLDLHSLGCDSFTASSHKWFMGPREVGLLYVREDRIPHLWPLGVGVGWGDDAEADPVGARRFETLGQRDDAAITAIGDTADFHQELGTHRVARRVASLARQTKLGMLEAGYELVTPMSEELSAGVCIARVAGERRREVFDALYRDFGVAGSTAGGLRLCPHVYNTEAHVERAIRGLGELRESLKLARATRL
jgi:selenocysteine lyase/cysteine desulfurase